MNTKPPSEVENMAARKRRRELLKAGYKVNLYGKLIAPAKPTAKAPVKPATKPTVTTPAKLTAKSVVMTLARPAPTVNAKLERQRATRKELMQKYDIR